MFILGNNERLKVKEYSIFKLGKMPKNELF